MRKRAVAVTALGILAAVSSCRRTLSTNATDARSDGTPSVGDAASFDIRVVDAPAIDGAAEAAGERDGDAIDAADAGVSVCPAGVRPLSVCGCGCCSGVAEGTACYYPSLGQTREGIPDFGPADPSCASIGCSSGLRYLCCGDPGRDPAPEAVCAIDTSIEDLARFTVTRRDGDLCTTLEVGSTASLLPIVGPPGRANTSAWRGRCDGTDARQFAIGGLGTISPGTSGTALPFPRFDVHVVLFFDGGLGVADAVRVDTDEVAVAPRCASGACPPCGATCQLDATYRFTTSGGRAAYRDATVLAPPASYTRDRRPEALPGTETSCAPPFPACGGSSVDVADVMAALSDPDVRDAFTRSMGAAALPFYGVDERGGDGMAVQITRDGGGGFLIGGSCPDAPTGPCTPIPAGVSRLLTTVSALDQQQLADPSCDFSQP